MAKRLVDWEVAMADDLAHLIGSVPLPDAETVFTQVAGALGDHLTRLPDGETGARQRWIFWQRTMLENHPAMEVDDAAGILTLNEWDGTLLRETDLLRFKADVDPDTVTFETGYDTAALASWEIFRSLQGRGAIPAHLRFQVCLPTPMSTAFMYVSPNAYTDYMRVYERSLLRALDNIVAGIPAEALSIQWDICQEVLVFEDYFPKRPADYKEQIFALMERLGDAVPEGVELGYHLCYGSPRDEHLVMPKNAGICAELAQAIFDRVHRPVNFLHLPVPKTRDDPAYFAPLAGLRLPEGTRLYLGLIHYDDAPGDRRRIAAARSVVKGFGISAECGWARGDADRTPGYLASHARAAKYLQSLGA